MRFHNLFLFPSTLSLLLFCYTAWLIGPLLHTELVFLGSLAAEEQKALDSVSSLEQKTLEPLPNSMKSGSFPLEFVATREQAGKKPNLGWDRHSLRLQFFLGYQGLRSHEYVLGNSDQSNSRGHKSELVWNSFKNLLFGVGFGKSSPQIQYYLQATATLSLDRNFIYDYDWEYQDKITKDAPSNYSRHDTVQNIMLEGLMRLGFPVFHSQRSLIHIGPGLFFSFVQWDAFDGERRNYIAGIASPMNGHVFTYGAWLLAPQIYLQFTQYFPPTLEMRLVLAYSPITLWRDKDNHYLRNLLFYDYGFTGQQIFGEIQFTFWNLKRSIGLVLGLAGRYLFEARGSTQEYDADDEGNSRSLQRTSYPSSGVEQGSFQIYAGVVLSLSSKNSKPATQAKF